MSVRDRWPFSRYEGRVRVEPGPLTDEERAKVRQGAPVFLVGAVVLGLSQDWLVTVFAMALTSVFVKVLSEGRGG